MYLINALTQLIMKRLTILFSLLIFVSACGSEPVNETVFVEFWESGDTLAYVGEETVSGEYRLENGMLGNRACFYLDEASRDLVPPSYFDLPEDEERSFCFSGAENFDLLLEAIELEFVEEGCVHVGDATLMITNFEINKRETMDWDKAVISEIIEIGEASECVAY